MQVGCRLARTQLLKHPRNRSTKIKPYYKNQKQTNKKKLIIIHCSLVCGFTLVIYMWFSHNQKKKKKKEIQINISEVYEYMFEYSDK